MGICSRCGHIEMNSNRIHHLIPHNKKSDIICDKCYQFDRYHVFNQDVVWRENRRNYRNSYNTKHRKEVRNNKHRYVTENIEIIRAYNREYGKLKSREDVNFRLSRQLRNRLNIALKNEYKLGSAVRDLGCSIDFLKIYIESLFLLGMNWKNQGRGLGKWHLDHIIPLAAFDLSDRNQFLKACHYTNLQPLWEIDNLRKGSK